MASHAAFRVLNDGKKVPAIAFGTGKSSFALRRSYSNPLSSKPGTALFGRHAKSEVAVALKAGITHIDCAEAYSNEESVGDALSEFFSSPNAPPRSSIYVTTKLGYTIPAGGSVRASLKKSLQKLKLDYVDLYLIHNPTNFVGHLKDIWRQMEEVKEEGGVYRTLRCIYLFC
jgi:diketogulonate reductase-like aldo/keto reductase